MAKQTCGATKEKFWARHTTHFCDLDKGHGGKHLCSCGLTW